METNSKTNLPKCPKCGDEMESGQTIEYKVPGGFDFNTNIPKAETWGSNIVKGFFNSVKKEIPIVTYRCVNCGFLESYAKTNNIQVSQT